MLVDYVDRVSRGDDPVCTNRERAESQVLLDHFEERWRVFWNLAWWKSWYEEPGNRPDDVTKAFGAPDTMTFTLYDGMNEQEARQIHAKFTSMLRHEIGWLIDSVRKKRLIREFKAWGDEKAPFWRQRELGEDICVTCGVPLTDGNRGKGPIRCVGCYTEFREKDDRRILAKRAAGLI